MPDSDINVVTISGEVCADPQVQEVGSNGAKKGRLRLAVKRRWTKDGEEKEAAAYLDVTGWRDLADIIGSLKTGEQIVVTGSLRSWAAEAKDGSGKKYGVEIEATTLSRRLLEDIPFESTEQQSLETVPWT